MPGGLGELGLSRRRAEAGWRYTNFVYRSTLLTKPAAGPIWTNCGHWGSAHQIWHPISQPEGAGSGAPTCPMWALPMWAARRERVHHHLLSSLLLRPCTDQSLQQLRGAHRGPPRDEAQADKVRRVCVGAAVSWHFWLPSWPALPCHDQPHITIQHSQNHASLPPPCSGSGGGSGGSRTGSCGSECRGPALAGSGSRCVPLHVANWCMMDTTVPDASISMPQFRCLNFDACC